MAKWLPARGELIPTGNDLAAGIAAGLVALPSATAFGLLVVAPLGPEHGATGASLGMLGAATIGVLAALFGGAPRLVSAPCAPAAAMLAGFVTHLVSSGGGERALGLLALVGLLTGLFQLALGVISAGRFIKYIPYSVVAGYMGGVGLIIVRAQLPKLVGASSFTAIASEARWDAGVIAVVTMVTMVGIPRLTRKVPAPILALAIGLVTYVILSLLRDPSALGSDHAPLAVGALHSDAGTWLASVVKPWSIIGTLTAQDVKLLVVQAATLAVLLSIDTLKTCVVLDALTSSRHESNKELVSQGIANFASACLGGMPGAGTMGATLVNVQGGAQRRSSGVVAGAVSLLLLLVFPQLFAWLPTAALAGILVIVGLRMIDTKMLALVKTRATAFDFLVVALVAVVALTVDLLAAAGAGVAMSIVLFLREQMRTPIVRRRRTGEQAFSSTKRLPHEIRVLEERGPETLVLELQDDLFFGTADQLYHELDAAVAAHRYVILGLRNVQSLDFSAAHTLEQAARRLGERKGVLILADVPDSVRTSQDIGRYLEEHGVAEGARIFGSLDEALEWVEDRVLAAAGCERPQQAPLPLAGIECLHDASQAACATLERIVVERGFAKGETIFRRGEPGDSLLFVRRGSIRVQIALHAGRALRLATFGPGDVCGEMAFIDGGMRSADAVALEDTSVFELSRAALDRAAKDAPEAAEVVFLGLARTLTTRLRIADRELHALQDA